MGYAKWGCRLGSFTSAQMPKSTHTPDYAVLLQLLRELRTRDGVLQADLARLYPEQSGLEDAS